MNKPEFTMKNLKSTLREALTEIGFLMLLEFAIMLFLAFLTLLFGGTLNLILAFVVFFLIILLYLSAHSLYVHYRKQAK